MRKPERVLAIIAALKIDYPEPICSLVYEKDYELLFATRLAAQCTDARVNLVTPHLFKRYPDLQSIADADVLEVEGLIRSTGFYRVKARDLVLAAQMLLAEFNGRVPDTMDELLRLPGIGRKTANLVLGDIHQKPGAVVVDTHCIRISNRLGLVQTKDPVKIEIELRKILPPDESNDFCHRLVLHGRAVCTARRAKCERCSLVLHCGEGQNITGVKFL